MHGWSAQELWNTSSKKFLVAKALKKKLSVNIFLLLQSISIALVRTGTKHKKFCLHILSYVPLEEFSVVTYSSVNWVEMGAEVQSLAIIIIIIMLSSSDKDDFPQAIVYQEISGQFTNKKLTRSLKWKTASINFNLSISLHNQSRILFVHSTFSHLGKHEKFIDFRAIYQRDMAK